MGTQAPNTHTATSMADGIVETIIGRIFDKDLPLPSIPSVVAKVLDVIQNADVNLVKVAEVIEADPVIAARLVRLVNSAAMVSREPATSVVQAIVRLGTMSLRSFLFEVSARAVFESKDARIQSAIAGLWEHSVAVALVSRELATEPMHLDPEFSESAYLVGLLQDIGKPVVAGMLLETERNVDDGALSQGDGRVNLALWFEIIELVHRDVGLALAEKWELPRFVQDSLKASHRFTDASGPGGARRRSQTPYLWRTWWLRIKGWT